MGTTTSGRLSVDVAAHTFLNSLLRGMPDCARFVSAPAGGVGEVVIAIDGDQEIRVPVSYFSPTQHHRFSFPAWRVTEWGREPVDFAAMVDLIVATVLRRQGAPEATGETFRHRVLQSHAHTHQAIEARHHDWATLREAQFSFARAEQALLVGHAFHPAPRSHEPFTPGEARRYLPDFAAHFPLRWFLVDRELVAGESLGIRLPQRLRRFVAENAPQLAQAAGDERWLFPLHPWQADHLLRQAWCRRLRDDGRIVDLGEAGASWLPTTSCRSLYCATSPEMIKFSLSVRLTNSLRTMSTKEVERGIRLARLARTSRWQEFQARFPTFRVMQEDCWAGLRDQDGILREESLFALRANLLHGRAGTQTNVLATLTQNAPDGGDSLLAAVVKRLATRLLLDPRQAAHVWLRDYCELVLTPLFVAEADHGLVLLAHQQNLLVEMENDLPVGAIYRDCQGSAFTAQAADWLREIGDTEVENTLTPEQVRRYLPYYLLVNSTFAVTAALASAGLASERELLRRVRRFLETLRDTVTRRACLDHVLDSPHWEVKSNFLCYLLDRDENTIADPAVIYRDVANPLLGVEEP
ncbi:IucA/IucC family siderophore biosynthesis protein [Micromonospora sp. HUAS LYJ1]|uniref:IucA/IucC family protein n=1 Tax=Micromonospora sp. HUAS LYJ1 TaxID=3061626 RepID=UPI0026736624|nr:IucA/IucC family protein [Micromonospora sp. HUAS LYJ1]WKU07147.1 IucA/IucC family protein [Micromonospora sp. HUAS LYJ1]